MIVRSIQTTVALELLEQGRHQTGTTEQDKSPLAQSIAQTVVALEELVAIVQQIAPFGTDARFDAWCSQHLIQQPTKECPSDHEPDHHITYI
jgi:hypothetical protein